MRYYSFLLAYILRLPLFFVAYSAMIVLNRDIPIFLFAAMLIVFTLVCFLDMIFSRRVAFAAVCIALYALFLLLRLPELLVVSLCAAIYRPTAHSRAYNGIWVMLSCVFAFIAGFINADVRDICMRNLLFVSLISVFSRMQQSLRIFLHSHHCRSISRKTAKVLIARSCKLVIPIIALLALGGILAIGLTGPGEPSYLENDLYDTAQDDLAQTQELVDGQNLSDGDGAPPPQDAIGQRIQDFYEILGTVEEILDRTEGLSTVIMYIVSAALMVLLICFVIFSSAKKPEIWYEDYDEVVDESTVESHALETQKARNRKPIAASIIRRIFASTVKRYMKKGLLFPKISDTPKHLAEEISKFEDIGVLERLYHKARYSGEAVTRDDLRRLNTERQ